MEGSLADFVLINSRDFHNFDFERKEEKVKEKVKKE